MVYLIKTKIHKSMIERPAIMSGNFEISLEFLLLLWQDWITKVRLLYEHNLVTITLYHLPVTQNNIREADKKNDPK